MEVIGAYEIRKTNENRLGSGTYGTVYKALNTETGKSVAAKLVEPLKDNQIWIHTFNILAKRELTILEKTRELPHRNILKIIHIENKIEAESFEDKKMWIISELCDLGDLNSYMKICDKNLNNALEIIKTSM